MSPVLLILIIASIILAVIGIYQYLAFNRIYYTDLAFTKFRELRHEATLHLASNLKKEGIDNKELLAYYSFLKNTSAVVENFGHVKAKFAKFESVKSLYKTIIFSSEKYNQLHENEYADLNMFKVKYADAILTYFRAIPFFKSRIIFELYQVLLELLIRIGFIRLKKAMARIGKLYSIEENVSRDKNCFNL